MWSGSLWVVFTVLNVVAVDAQVGSCLQGVNCHLPACFCSTNTINMDKNEIPQIVYFGFDDALNTVMAKHYRRLFSPDRRNPNGCPVSMTLYVQDRYTSYNLVNEFYKRGMEIGVHSVTHTSIDTPDKLLYEADEQRKNLAFRGHVPIKELVGWRSPNLKTAGDAQPDILQGLGYTYDISLTVTRRKIGAGKPWPFTLDYGNPHKCMIRPCPDSSHPGFWEVPVNSLMDYKNEYPCPYVDGCYNRADTEDQAFKYLWQNFLDYYEGSRTPLGLNMHAAWFMTSSNLKAMDRFIKKILALPDVYIVSVNKMLDWVKHPTPLSRIPDLQSWNCGLKPIENARTSTAKVAIPFRQTSTASTATATTTTPTTPTTSTTTTTTTTAPQTTTISTTTTTTTTTTSPSTTTTTTTTTPTPTPTTSTITTTTTTQPTTTITTTTTKTRPPPAVTSKAITITTKTITLPTATTTRQTPIPTEPTISTTGKHLPTTPTPLYPTPARHSTTTSASDTKLKTSHSSKSEYTSSTSTVSSPTFNESHTMQTSPMAINASSTASKNGTTPRVLNAHRDPPDLYALFGISPSQRPASWLRFCLQGWNCKLPDCLCRTTEPPLGIPREETPQMVYFTFDGSISPRSYFNLMHLFNPARKNSNNCSISTTLFVSRSGNNVNYLERLLENGMEVGLRGDDMDAYHRSETLGIDLGKEIDYLKAKYSVENIKGWRSPALQPLGDDQFRLIKSHGLLYDSTLSIPASESRKDLPWPYTLDFKWQEKCESSGCPVKRYPGVWEVPVAPILDYTHMYLCTYADGCMRNPPTADDTYNFLWSNFKDRYDANRTPLSITLRQQWFSHPVYKPNLEGLDRFIKQLVSMPDVYIVSIEKVIEWMRNPTTLQDIHDFEPWQCN